MKQQSLIHLDSALSLILVTDSGFHFINRSAVSLYVGHEFTMPRLAGYTSCLPLATVMYIIVTIHSGYFHAVKLHLI
jgi:hypothetical protein